MILSKNTKYPIRAWVPTYNDFVAREKLDIYKFTREDQDIYLSVDPKKFYIFFWSKSTGVKIAWEVPGLKIRTVTKNRSNYKKAISGEIYYRHKIYFDN